METKNKTNGRSQGEQSIEDVIKDAAKKSGHSDAEIAAQIQAIGKDPAVIEKWLTRDLDACVALLNAIRSDASLKSYMVQWFIGRWNNHLEKEKQVKVGLDSKLFD